MKTDIFKFFDELNKENYAYVDSLTDDEVKSLSGYVLLMWMNGAVDNTHLHVLLTDMYCNPYVFSLSKHPRLILKLFVAANGGMDNTRYKFVKQTRSSESKKYVAIAEYYGCSLNQAKDYARILDDEDIKRAIEIHEFI